MAALRYPFNLPKHTVEGTNIEIDGALVLYRLLGQVVVRR
jgi:hypothetical protein